MIPRNCGKQKTTHAVSHFSIASCGLLILLVEIGPLFGTRNGGPIWQHMLRIYKSKRRAVSKPARRDCVEMKVSRQPRAGTFSLVRM